jgi:hypothetical protein
MAESVTQIRYRRHQFMGTMGFVLEHPSHL